MVTENETKMEMVNYANYDEDPAGKLVHKITDGFDELRPCLKCGKMASSLLMFAETTGMAIAEINQGRYGICDACFTALQRKYRTALVAREER